MLRIIDLVRDSSDVTSTAAVLREFSVPSMSIVRIQPLRGWIIAKVRKSSVEVNGVFDFSFYLETSIFFSGLGELLRFLWTVEISAGVFYDLLDQERRLRCYIWFPWMVDLENRISVPLRKRAKLPCPVRHRTQPFILRVNSTTSAIPIRQ